MSIPIKTLTLPISSGGSTTETEYSFITPDDMDQKADIDGYFEEMTVGDAEQLVATQYVSDSEPYLFRTTGGSADVGNREYKKSIVGGTVAWNQLVENGNFANGTTGWSPTRGIISASGNILSYESTAIGGGGAQNRLAWSLTEIPANHVILASMWVNPAHTTIAEIQMRAGEMSVFTQKIVTGGVWQNVCSINKYSSALATSSAGNVWFALRETSDNGYAIGDVDQYKNVMVHDLTQMFGSTIADYIYSLEQATAGAGVAFFKKLFPKDYYPYDAGSLKHVEGLSEHVTVGFNQWDEEWEGGSLDTATGNPSTVGSQTRIRSKNFIPVIAGQTYYFTNLHGGISDGLVTVFYDADKNYIEGAWRTGSYLPFIVPSGARYMKFNTGDAYGGTYRGDICINLSWSGYRNGEYEPYEEHSYPLDDSLVLRGIPKLDSSNNLYFDGDVYNADGSVERKYGIVDLGTLNYNYDSTNNRFSTSNIPVKIAPQRTLYFMSDRYTTIVNQNFNIDWDMVVYNNNNIQGAIFHNHAYTDAASFKTAMSGVYLVYELATPTTEEAEPYNEVQICDDFGTEEFVSTSIVPVGHNTEYPANLRDKLQHLPDLSDSDGVFAILQSNKQMSLTTIPTAVAELPEAPTEDGSYVLKATVSNGSVTYAWEAE